MFRVHATKKLFDRLGSSISDPLAESTTSMENWYGTALFWRPQVALFVNETTLLPVLVHLAPAQTVVARFATSLARVLDELHVPHPLVDREIDLMGDRQLARTINRSVLGVMNEFSYLADAYGRAETSDDLLRLSLNLAGTPCGPLRARCGFPDQEVSALFAAQTGC